MIRPSVFGSASEKELFAGIQSQWGDRFAVYPSQPFASIIDFQRLDLLEEERRFLYATSVDYTLCTKSGQPLLSVEFDGFSHGFSQRGHYVQMRAVEDSRRAWKLNLKIRVADQVGYPFFVVSYEEKNPISEHTHLTILDGIIGQALAHRHFKEEGIRQIQEILDSTPIEAMLPDERDVYIQNLVTSAEVDAELTWDPISREEARVHFELWERGVLRSFSLEFVNDPELPDGNPLEDPEVLKARIKALEQVRRVGCKVTLYTVLGDIEKTAWIRNFEHAEVGVLGLAEDIAMYLACTEALNLANRQA